MSVVSRELGFIPIPRTRHVPNAVQYDKNDSGEPEPSEFAVPPQMPTFNLSKKIRRPYVDLDVPVLNYVPLKCHQVGTHPDGSALFNADTPAWTAPLDIESDVPFPTKAYEHVSISKYPDVAPSYPYDKGISGVGRPIKFDDVSEPTAMMYRTASKVRAYAPSSINYDLGVDELRAMAKRTH